MMLLIVSWLAVATAPLRLHRKLLLPHAPDFVSGRSAAPLLKLGLQLAARALPLREDHSYPAR